MSKWVTEERLTCVLASMVGKVNLEHTEAVIGLMFADIETEDDLLLGREERRMVANQTARMFRRRLDSKLDGV